MKDVKQLLRDYPLIAILRGVTPQEVLPIVDILVEEGIRIVEVPLNSPAPLESIALIAQQFGDVVVTGAGTVLDASSVDAVASAGGEIIVAPNCDAEVIARARILGLEPFPGVATPTEAFAAIRASAQCLKLFPAEGLGPGILKAWRSVLPPEVMLIPVGGVTPANLAAFRSAGATAFGVGSSLYKAGASIDDVRKAARQFVAAERACRA
jgi:2-dehydro-3-deoxyphosphogalactonate aldolase